MRPRHPGCAGNRVTENRLGRRLRARSDWEKELALHDKDSTRHKLDDEVYASVDPGSVQYELWDESYQVAQTPTHVMPRLDRQL